MQYAITGSLFLITLAGAATVQDRTAEQDGFGIELKERLTERGTIRLDFGATISASSYRRGGRAVPDQMAGIGATGNAANTWNNGGRGWTEVRAAGIEFAIGATGVLLQNWPDNGRLQ